MVVVLGVEGEFCEDEAIVVDDCRVEVVDEADDLGAGVGSSDSEVEESAAEADTYFALVVDGVVAHSPEFGVVGVVDAAFGMSW